MQAHLLQYRALSVRKSDKTTQVPFLVKHLQRKDLLVPKIYQKSEVQERNENTGYNQNQGESRWIIEDTCFEVHSEYSSHRRTYCSNKGCSCKKQVEFY